jgi:hypothetical protein
MMLTRRLQGQEENLEKHKERIPACQERIDQNIVSDTLMGTILSHFS